MIEGITNKEQSWEIDGLARRVVKLCPSDKTHEGNGECPEGICEGSGEIKPYAETGIGGWLAERPCEGCGGTGQPLDIISRKEVCRGCDGSGKAGVWPGLVWWRWHDTDSWHPNLWQAAQPQPRGSYVHAFSYTLALEFLVECYKWAIVWDTVDLAGHWRAQPHGYGMKWIHAATESNLLDKMLAAVEEAKERATTT